MRRPVRPLVRRTAIALSLACPALLAGCGTAGTGSTAASHRTTATGTPTAGGTATAAARPTRTVPPATVAQDLAAFFAGCEDGTVPPPGIFVTCDPSDGSDTAPAAATATCARLSYDLGALAPATAGTAIGVENGGFDGTPSGLAPAGSTGRLLRCTYGPAARVDVAPAPAARSGRVTGDVAAPGSLRCEGHLAPGTDVACLTPAGTGVEVVLERAVTAAQLSPALAALAADPA